MILFYQLLQGKFGFCNFFRRGGCRGVDDGSVQHLSRCVHNGKFATRAESGVPPQNNFAYNWRLHKQLFQILSENGNCAVFRFFRQRIAYFRCNAGFNQPCVTVGNGKFKKWRGVGVVPCYHLFFQIFQNLIGRCNYFYRQYLFRFATVYGKHTVTGNFKHRFFVLVVIFVHRFLFGIFGDGGYFSQTESFVPDNFAVIGVVGNYFGNYVQGALQSLFHGFYALFIVDEFFCKFLGVFVRLLQQNDVGKRFQPLFFCHRGTGAAFGTVGTVQVFHSHLRFGVFYLLTQFVGKFALFVNAFQYLCLFLFQIAQVVEPFKQFAQLLVVELSRGFLAVARDEGNGVSFVNQRNGGVRLPPFYLQFFGNFLIDIHIDFKLLFGAVVSKRPKIIIQ